jgi:hypothetical protein
MRRVVQVAVLSCLFFTIGCGALSEYLVVNHFPSGLSAFFLSVGFAGITLIPLSLELEWYLPSKLIENRWLRVLTLVSTGLLIVGTAYWVIAAISSPASEISSFQFISNGLDLSIAASLSYFFVAMVMQVANRNNAA